MDNNEFKTGECEWCGNHGAVYIDNDRCAQCDSNIFHCSICKDDQHVDDLCRHVFRASNYEWAGAGVGDPDDEVKSSLQRLLDLMPAGFAADLRAAIRSGRFHTWLVAPLIGGGGSLYLYGMPDHNGRSTISKWGDAIIEIGEGDDAEETVDGYQWLASLYERQTRKANKITIAWLDEWLATNERRESLARWADDGGSASALI